MCQRGSLKALLTTGTALNLPKRVLLWTYIWVPESTKNCTAHSDFTKGLLRSLSLEVSTVLFMVKEQRMELD